MDEKYEVVISGVGGKFPEADHIDELKEKLMNKENLMTVDERRWQSGLNGTPPALGKVRSVEKFDYTFFGIHRRLSNFMDPQNRHILERSYEAIIDSGYNPISLKGANIGVFMAAGLNETEYILITQKIHDGFGIVGLSRAMLPNRVSYFFNFKGPSHLILSSWDTGLEVLTYATNQIKEGHIDGALVGVSNLHMFSQTARNYVNLGWLTFDESMKPFDADANGYVLSEAIVILFLQRKQDARRIYATVVHSDRSLHGERSTPFTVCPEKPIVSFLKDFYKRCQIDPKTVSFVEADGCAIKERDLTELKSLSQVLGEDKEGGLLVGSVKSNLGHTQIAANIVSVVKALIALETGIIPSNIMFKKPLPQQPAKIKVVADHTPLKGNLVAVNALSFGGGFGHTLLKQNSKKKEDMAAKYDCIPRLILMSARNLAGAETVIDKVSSMTLDYEFVSMVNDIHQFDIPGHLYHTYIVHPGNTGKPVFEYAELQSEKAPVWFVFSGMGSQWPGMGRDLLKIKVFADSVAKCDKVLAPRGVNIYDILTNDDPKVFDNILYCFVGIACVQAALVDLLYAIGIKPDGIIGHSLGELGCAYADGTFTAEQMVLSAYARGRASLETELIRGAMAAVGIGYKKIKDKLPFGVEVACRNSSESCTISGPENDVKNFVNKLTEEGIFVRLVKSANLSYHSQYIAPAGPKLLAYLKEVIPHPKPRTPRWISSSIPHNEWNTPLAQFSSPEYHTNNLLSPVFFEEACKNIPSKAICIEIAPHGLLQAIVRRSLTNCIHIPLTLRNSSCAISFLLSAIGKLYLNNVYANVNALFPKVEYPVSRETPSIASFVTWDHSENWTYGEKNRTIYASNEKKIDFNLQHKKYREISNYKIQKCVTVPTFVLLNFVWKKLMKMQGLKILETPVVFEDVWIHEVLTISEFSSLSLCVTVQQASGQFEVSLVDQDGCSAKSLMSGNCTAITTKDLSSQSVVIPSRSILESSYLHISQSDLYDIFNTYGYSFTDTFKNVNEIYVGDNDIIGKIEWTGNWVAFLEGLTQVIMYSKLDETLEQSLYIPVHIQRLQIDPKEFISDTKSEEVSVCLKPELNIIYCEGVQLEGLTLKVLGIDKPLSELYVESPVFVPHGTTKFKNPNDFIAACIQVVHANKFGCGVWMHGHSLTQYPAVLLEDSQHQFIYKRELQNNIESISGSELTNDDIEICLLVTSANTVYQPVTFRKPIANCEFYLIQSVSYFNPGHKIFNNFMVIFQQRFNNTCLTLLKQKQIKHIEYIHGTDLNKSELLSLIKVSINKINNSDEIGVIFNNMSIMSSYTTLQTIRKEQNNSQIKSIFVLGGEPSSNFPLSLQQCEDELMKGLSVNFFKNGQWGSIIMTNLIENKTKENLPIPQNCNKQIELKYFSLNPSHFNYGSSLKTNPSLGPLEFSGLLNSKEKVMGFASWDITQVRTALEIDDDFVWKVPELWTLEDAATVPFSFSLAIFSLKLLMKLKPTESILVHSGFSTLSQAVISVALQIGSTVFTTVNTERQKQELISLFPELNGYRILQLENDWFEAQILSLTRGNRVHVIFSTLAGDSFQASLKCLAANGRFMQLNKADMELGYKIGMSVFERNTSLYGYDTDNLFLIPNEWKKTIYAEVKKGIEMGYIKPLSKQTFQLSSQFSEAVTHVLNKDGEAKVVLSVEDNDTCENISKNCDSKSYIIVGSGSGLWLDVLEVLARNGAHNLITVIDQTTVTGSQSRKINKLISTFNATIQTLSVHQLNTIQSTEKFFNNLLLPFGQIDSIFIMLKDSDQHCIHNLDVVTRRLVPDIKFVCLMGAGERVCESRRNSGLHATAIISSSQTIHPRSVLPLLRSICLESTQNELVLLSQLSTNKDNDYEICNKLLETYLPVGVPELKLLSSSLQDKYYFTEVRSLSPYMNDLPNATPIFVIPGLNLSNMTPLILQLMAPVFCAQLPSDLGSAKETAKHLIAPLLEIQPKGPYNIIGETWSGGVALELARLLEESGNKVLVTLLSGTPHTVQHLVKSLGSYDSYNFNKNLLSMTLQLPVEVFDQANESVNGEPAWDESVSKILKNLNENCGDSELYISLSAIHSRVKSLMDYEIFPLKQSSIALLHANNSFIGSNLHKLYGDNVIVHLMENCDHHSMLSSVKTADLINELINFTF